MPIQYDENGIVTQNLSDILDERESSLQPILGNDFVISGESVIGNIELSDGNREFDIQELVDYIVNQWNPDTAEGIFLDYICAFNNIIRLAPTKTNFDRTVTGTPSLSVLSGTLTIKDDTTGYLFKNSNDFVIGVGGTVSTQFEALEYGDINVETSATFTITTPLIGVTSVTYTSGQTTDIGCFRETDNELRARRNSSLQISASSILTSIISNVRQVENVDEVVGIENDTLSTVDTIPGKAFEIIVLGGDDADIASAILEKKPVGIQAYGTTIETVIDNENSFNIGFTRPTTIDVAFTIDVNVSALQGPTWEDTVKQAIVDFGDNNYSIGDDIIANRFNCVLYGYDEISEVTNLQVKELPSGSFGSSVAILSREIAGFDVSNIAINQTVV